MLGVYMVRVRVRDRGRVSVRFTMKLTVSVYMKTS